MILVDAIREHETKLRHKHWCHMVSTESEEELHAFANRLGLKREWVQLRPKASAAHYDLTPSKRALAMKLGAKEVSARELVMENFDGLFKRPRCGKYVGDNDATCPILTCQRAKGHSGDCDNTRDLST
jgi:hypothetical protein